jgi:hypothetical protein
VSDPAAVLAARAQRAQRLAEDQAAMRRLLNRWMGIEEALAGDVEALAEQIVAAGPGVTTRTLLEWERAQRLLLAAREEVGRFQVFASRMIDAGRSEAINAGLTWGVDVMRISYEAAGSAYPTLTRMTAQAVMGIPELAAAAQTEVISLATPEALEAMLAAMARAAATQPEVSDVAQAAFDQLGQGLDSSITAYRSVTGDAYREATRQQFLASGMVQAYRRVSARAANTCLGCLLADGMIVPSIEEFDEHLNGLCELIPVVDGLPMDEWQVGADWLREQDPDTQRHVLGPGRFEAFKEGRVSLEDLRSRKVDPQHGGAWVPTLVRDLPGGSGTKG